MGEKLEDCITTSVINRIGTIPTGQNPTGSIRSGFLEIKAKAKKSDLSMQSDGIYCLLQVFPRNGPKEWIGAESYSEWVDADTRTWGHLGSIREGREISIDGRTSVYKYNYSEQIITIV